MNQHKKIIMLLAAYNNDLYANIEQAADDLGHRWGIELLHDERKSTIYRWGIYLNLTRADIDTIFANEYTYKSVF